MRSLLICIATFFILTFSSCQQEESRTPHFFEIEDNYEMYRFAHERKADSLYPYLQNSQPEFRSRAALLLGSIQDPSSLAKVLSAMNDSIPEVRKNAAYTLSQLADSSAFRSIRNFWLSDTQLDVKRELLIALGKSTSNSTSDILVSSLSKADCQEHPSWALYWAGIEGFVQNDGVSLAFDFLECEEEETRLGAAHFLARTPELDLLGASELIWQRIDSDPSNDVKLALITSLKHAKSNENKARLEAMLSREKNDLMLVNTIRALKRYDSLNIDVTLPLLTHQSSQVSETAASFIASKEWTGEMGVKIDRAFNQCTPIIKAKLFKGFLKNDRMTKLRLDELENQITNISDPFLKAEWISIAKDHPEAEKLLIKYLSTDRHAAISTAAAESLIAIKESGEWNGPSFDRILNDALQSGDVTQQHLFCTHLMNEKMGYLQSFKDVHLVENILATLQLPRDIETYQEVKKCYKFLTNKEYERAPYSSSFDFSQAKLMEIDEYPQIDILTTKGNIRVELDLKSAPASVLSLLNLINEGFYEGKAFHRVVPNFVIQAGCPRGDGWGNVDYTITSEFSNHQYRTGTLGMASAGKDTEGCQWFITHSPTPHLEGNYTAFGKVISGMDVVQKIQRGDLIEAISLVNAVVTE